MINLIKKRDKLIWTIIASKQYVIFLKIKKNIKIHEVNENNTLKRQHFRKNKLYIMPYFSFFF